MKERLFTSFKKNLIISVVFLACSLLIRLYVWFAIADRINSSMIGRQLTGFMEDIGIAAICSLCVISISVPVSLISARVARIVSLILFVILLIIDFSIHQYFVVTLIPLSTDLFGYTINDISTTVGSSVNTLGISITVCVLILSAFFAIGWFILKRFETINTKLAFGIFSTIVIIAVLPWRVQPEDFEDDLSYFIATNKFRYLTNQSIEYFTESNQQTFAANAYPLLHKVNYTDSLSKYFTPSNAYPNIVFLIIEGMGRDFCGPNAPYGGFTPFLDSLSQKSLYWPHALSNAGRTFGAPPSILGSLPYGRLGLMSYGNEMPDHQTLITLLKPYGYHSNFFYGGNPNFDNLDLFLERQGIDFFLNESNFPSALKSRKAFWGYADTDLFNTALEKIESEGSPRLDVFLTVSTHEPFVCPDTTLRKKVANQINNLPDSKRKDNMLAQPGVFECLFYTDQAIKNLMKGYSKRSDFNNTVFIITGDHRIIPIPQDDKIARFHVPIMIYSPMLNKPQTFSSITTHSSILPSLLGFLNQRNGMKFPDELPLISGPLSLKKEFSSDLNIALIRNKNEVKDYVSGTHFLSEGRLYTINSNFGLKVSNDNEVKDRMTKQLKEFQAASLFAIENNRLDKILSRHSNLFTLTASEEKYLQSIRILNLSADEQFMKARELAFNDQKPKSRSILKNLLNKSPNYHDARILMARTYSWDGHYDSAKFLLDQTMQRAPNYADVYSALSDVYYWQDSVQRSLNTLSAGLQNNPTNSELLSRQARALDAIGKPKKAKVILDSLSKRGFENEITLQLKRKFKSK